MRILRLNVILVRVRRVGVDDFGAAVTVLQVLVYITKKGDSKVTPRHNVCGIQDGHLGIELNGRIKIDDPSDKHHESIANHQDSEPKELSARLAALAEHKAATSKHPIESH